MECNCKYKGQDSHVHEGKCARVALSPEAKVRIAAKVESVKRARLHAMAHAHETVIG